MTLAALQPARLPASQLSTTWDSLASLAINFRSEPSRSYTHFLHLAAMAESTDLTLKRDQHCGRCWSMTTTLDGLSALTSGKGCDFWNWEELTDSADTGCLLCKWICDSCKVERWESPINKTDAFQLRWNVPTRLHHQYSPTKLLLRSPISTLGDNFRIKLLSRLLRKDCIAKLYITIRSKRDHSKTTDFRVYISDGM